MDWLSDASVLIWLGLALILGTIEVATLGFVFLMLAGAAVVGAGLAGTGQSFPVQVVGAVISAFLLLGVLRPLMIRRVLPGSPSLTGTAALIGHAALVVTTVTPLSGQVKINGEVWSARLASPRDFSHELPSLLVGQMVRIAAIKGATAIVEPLDHNTKGNT
ncbi:MAG: NfeD family protein [Actinomycetota bacterium]